MSPASATADGLGGVTDVVPIGESVDGALIPFTMAESASASSLAAAAAFLPEAAVFAIAGATIGSLIWDAATQTYELPGPYSTSDTCPDGSQALGKGLGAPYDPETLATFISVVSKYHGEVTSDSAINIGVGVFWGGYEATWSFNQCSDGSNPVLQSPEGTPVAPSALPTYLSPWLASNPSAGPQLFNKEMSSGDIPDAGPGGVLSGPSSTTFPPTTTTVKNPDGSESTSTVTPTVEWHYSGPNASGSTSVTTKTATIPAPTSSDPTPAPIPGPTSTSSSAGAPVSSAPQIPFVPPTTPVPTVPPVPPGVINLPIPTIDNSSGTCPAPLVLNIGLPGVETVTWDLTPWCTLASNLQPLVLIAAGLASAFLLVR